jgi:hypothetical protein
MPKAKPPAEVEYTEALGETICDRVAEGEALIDVCNDPEMPCLKTVRRWLARHPEFKALYDLSQEFRADGLVHQAGEIVDTPKTGEKRVTKSDGSVEVTEGDMIEHRKMQAKHRVWLAGKLNPKKYGDVMNLRHGDPDGNNPFASLMEIVAANGRPRPATGS